MALKFRRNPVIVEAMKFTYPPTPELFAWCPDITAIQKGYRIGSVSKIEIRSIEDGPNRRENVFIADEGDWIIKGLKGEFYSCKPDIFEATYEAAE